MASYLLCFLPNTMLVVLTHRQAATPGLPDTSWVGVLRPPSPGCLPAPPRAGGHLGTQHRPPAGLPVPLSRAHAGGDTGVSDLGGSFTSSPWCKPTTAVRDPFCSCFGVSIQGVEPTLWGPCPCTEAQHGRGLAASGGPLLPAAVHGCPSDTLAPGWWPDMTRPTRSCLGHLSRPACPAPQGGRGPQSPELWACGLLVTHEGCPWGGFARHTEGTAVPLPVRRVSYLCPVSYMKPQPGRGGSQRPHLSASLAAKETEAWSTVSWRRCWREGGWCRLLGTLCPSGAPCPVQRPCRWTSLSAVVTTSPSPSLSSARRRVAWTSGSQDSRAPPTLPCPLVDPELCLNPAGTRDFSGS